MQHETVGQKVRFKMYKDGKRWVISGIAIVGATFGMMSSALDAKASPVAQSPAQQESVVAEKSSPGVTNSEEKSATDTTQTTVNPPMTQEQPEKTNQPSGQTQTVSSSPQEVNASSHPVRTVNAPSQTDQASKPETKAPDVTVQNNFKTGDQVKDIDVIKTVDPVDKTENPTINPKEHTDETDTNYYPGTKIKQSPIYVDGKLGNPPGKDAVSKGDKIGNDNGPINRSQWMEPSHENEVINSGFYNGTNLFMTGWADNNSSLYLYTYDKNKQLIKTERFEGPNSAKFDPNWTFTDKTRDLKAFWKYGYLQMEVISSNRVAFVSAPQYIDKIPVKFVDKFGSSIAPETTTGGYADTFVTVEVPHIDGYRLIQVPYMNNDHKFLITNQEKTEPSTEWTYVQQTSVSGMGRRIVDDRNTQEVYLTYRDEKSKTYTVKATPNAFIGQSFKGGWVLVGMPQPVGNPLTFVYEPIAEYKLAVNYLEDGTGKVMHTPYIANGAGTYEINSPEFYNYIASIDTAKGVLSKDTTINVYYKLKDSKPITPDKPVIPATPVTPVTPDKPIIVIPVIPGGTDKPSIPVVPTETGPSTTPSPQKITNTPTPMVTADPTSIPPAEKLDFTSDQADKKKPVLVNNGKQQSTETMNVKPGRDETPTQKKIRKTEFKVPATKQVKLNIKDSSNQKLPQTGDYESTQLTIVGTIILAITALIGGLVYEKRKH